MACETSLERRKDLAMDWERRAGEGDKRSRREGIREDSAPVVDTEPISSQGEGWSFKAFGSGARSLPSWLKSAMQFTLPSSVRKSEDDAKLAKASKAQNLSESSK